MLQHVRFRSRQKRKPSRRTSDFQDSQISNAIKKARSLSPAMWRRSYRGRPPPTFGFKTMKAQRYLKPQHLSPKLFPLSPTFHSALLPANGGKPTSKWAQFLRSPGGRSGPVSRRPCLYNLIHCSLLTAHHSPLTARPTGEFLNPLNQKLSATTTSSQCIHQVK